MSALDHAVLDGLRARLADTEARLAATEQRADRLRGIVNECARALGNGAFVDDASDDFAAKVPDEIRFVVNRARALLAYAVSRIGGAWLSDVAYEVERFVRVVEVPRRQSLPLVEPLEARLTATETAHARTAAQVIALDAQLVEARRRGHELANRCAAAEGLLQELVDAETDGNRYDVDDALAAARAFLVRRDAGGVAVGATADGGGARGGEPAPSAPGRAT